MQCPQLDSVDDNQPPLSYNRRTMLYISRHGQTQLGADELCCGRTDACLTPQGFAEARCLALALQQENITFSKIYCSTMQRAVETLAEILKLNPGAVEYLPELRERDFGCFEGRSRESFAEAMRSAGVPPDDFTPPGGESVNDLRLRLAPFVARIREDLRNGDVLIVAHGNINRMLLVMLLGGSFRDYGQANCCIHRLRRHEDGRLTAEKLNDTSHIRLAGGSGREDIATAV